LRPWLLTCSFFHPDGLTRKYPKPGLGYGGFASEVQKEVVDPLIAEVKAELAAQQGEIAAEATRGMSRAQKARWEEQHGQVGAAVGKTIEMEIKELLEDRETNDFTHTDPLQYWLRKEKVWPLLYPRAIAALSRSLTSCDTERYFSTLNWIVTNRRTRLLTEHVDSLATLKQDMQTACNVIFGEGKVNYGNREEAADSLMFPPPEQVRGGPVDREAAERTFQTWLGTQDQNALQELLDQDVDLAPVRLPPPPRRRQRTPSTSESESEDVETMRANFPLLSPDEE
jgi:hypothetical protein